MGLAVVWLAGARHYLNLLNNSTKQGSCVSANNQHSLLAGATALLSPYSFPNVSIGITQDFND